MLGNLLPYSGILCEFCGLLPFTKIFSVKFGTVAFFGVAKSAKVFSVKIVVFFHQFTKVLSLESFPLYSMSEPHSGNLSPYQMTQISPQVLDTSKQFIGGECPSPFCSRLQVGS